ncbi:hypothetical protein Tco_1284885 [Tanacetum coccineum]
MSDSDESGITYMEVLPSPDYVHVPEEPEQAPPSPDYVPGPEYADDEIVAEDDSPTAQSPDYVLESDPEADPEEDDDEDPEEDPVDYPADGGDGRDDEDRSSEDDEDDDMDIEADDEEEEEHLAPIDSVVSAATLPPYPAYRVTARISIPAPVPTPVWFDAEVPDILGLSTPPSPLALPMVFTTSPYTFSITTTITTLTSEAASTSHFLPLPPPFILSPTRPDAPSLGIPPPLSISVPTSSPPLLLPSASHREDRPEVTLPPRKRLGIAFGPRYEVGESSSAAAARLAGGLRADYGFVATIDREIRHDPQREVGYGITN